MGKFNVWLCTAFVALAMWAAPASADSVTYTFEGFGTAEIGLAGTTTTDFVITLEADTNNIIDYGGGFFEVPIDTAHAFFAGYGTVAILDPLSVFVNGDVVGLSLGQPLTLDLLDLRNAAFLGYELDTDLGPIFDPAPFAVNQFQNIAISATGDLSFSRIIDTSFTADVVPEPASMALFAISGGLIYWRRKRQRA